MVTPPKIFIPPKIIFFLKTTKNVEIQNFEPKNDPSLRMYEYQSPPPPPPPPKKKKKKITRAYVCMNIRVPPPPPLWLLYFLVILTYFYQLIRGSFGKFVAWYHNEWEMSRGSYTGGNVKQSICGKKMEEYWGPYLRSWFDKLTNYYKHLIHLVLMIIITI